MTPTRTPKAALALTGLGALLASARPAQAQDLVYTLTGVTFNDGAVGTVFACSLGQKRNAPAGFQRGVSRNVNPRAGEWARGPLST